MYFGEPSSAPCSTKSKSSTRFSAATAVTNKLKTMPIGPRPLALAARLLTVLRAIAIGPFLWLFVAVARDGRSELGAWLAALYLAAALSDLCDGKLARAAGAVSARWGFADVAADVAFNLSSLACAAWLGLVGPWVPAGVAILAGRYFARVRSGTRAPRAEGPAYDVFGNLAGVVYYALVGVVVAGVSAGLPGPAMIARLGDAAFLYTLVTLWRGRSRPRDQLDPASRTSAGGSGSRWRNSSE